MTRAEAREAKFDRMGDPLAALNEHVDFVVIAEEITAKCHAQAELAGRPIPLSCDADQQLFNLLD